jgi:Flp pilus assembly protein TadD
LKGFILSAQNDPRAAIAWFDRAIAVDAALGNARLGRGLARIRLRETEAGRQDLLTAAALEPQRAELRSYLGKAYVAAGDDEHATKELNLAKKLDPNDPTAWLYSALQKQQDNQINDAIRDLEKSQSLNDNRSVYRSRLLLDQDNAVRAADLAGIYGDAGFSDVSLREAGRAVSYDYANYSAHLFLANSYDQLRDPNWSNLRYETPAVSEFAIAQLLAPASAGVLSSATAQQPYTKLFDQNRVGVTSDTTYLSRGAWMESGSQFGTYDNFSYSFDADYLTDNGQRVNNDNEQRSLSLTLKDQITPQDSVFATVQQVKIRSGDVNEYYDQADAGSDFRFNETQQPNLYLGYHHEWGPGSHTLFYAARTVAYDSASADSALQYIGAINNGVITAVADFANSFKVRVKPEVNSTELQQILESPDHTTIIGTRYEWGNVHYQNAEANADFSLFATILFPDPDAYPVQNFTLDFYHWNAYAYHTWQIADPFAVTVGLDYDWLHEPANVGSAPFTEQEKTSVQFSPKIGFIWQPADKTTFRAAYTRSLSGFINGQSTRIEPTEVAGFNQAFRDLIPDPVVGDTSGSRLDTYDVSFEQKLDTGTYLALGGELLYGKAANTMGAYLFNFDQTLTNAYPTYTTGFKQDLDFHEYSLTFSVNQLLGRQWSAGANYRLSQANLDWNFPGINTPNLENNVSSLQPYQNLTSVLNHVNLHANWNHPSGLFALFTADWYHQHNSGFTPGEPGDDFWQFNAYAGWRLWKRRVEFTVGLLNLFDQNYRLEPLNLYNETARNRTFVTSLRISF